MSEIIKVSEKAGIKVDEYKGSYKLNSCYNGYVQWAKYKVSKDAYAEKDRPISVELGDKSQAESVLLQILKEITGIVYVPQGDEEIPF